MKKIRLMLVNDQDVAWAGLKSHLQTQEDFEVVGEAGNSEQAVQRAMEIRPDVIVMDISMPEVDGLEATRRLRHLCPDCLILALTVQDDRQLFMQMLAEGVSGYVTKQAAADDLVTAIHTLAAGNAYLQPALARWLLEDYQRLSRQAGGSLAAVEARHQDKAVELDVLSLRERQVLELVAQGKNNHEIGKAFDLSPKTIARHRERIMGKLDMHSRTELVRFAIRTGLTKLD